MWNISQQQGLAKGKYHSYKVIVHIQKIGKLVIFFGREPKFNIISIKREHQRPSNIYFLTPNLAGVIGLIAYTV